jgi:two-component system cell cycle sensor histidine kinase/response regulator CckA
MTEPSRSRPAAGEGDANRRLAEAEETIRALVSGKVDAILDGTHRVPLLLREAQSALQASEERYRTIVTTAAEGIWTLDTAARTTFVNDQLAAMLGYTAEEMIGRSLYDFMDRETRAAAARYFMRRDRSTGEGSDFLLRRKDGSALWTRPATSPLLGARGEFLGTLAMVSDVTERRRAAEERARYVAVVESSESAICIKGLDGTILTWNAGAERLYGYRSSEAIGRPISMLVPPARSAELRHILGEIRAGRPIRHLETVRRCKDGTEVVVLLSISPLRDLDGRLRGAAVIATDVTELRRAEEMQRKLESRFRLLVEHSVDGIALLSPEGRFTYASPSAERILERPAGELLHRQVCDLVHPDDAPSLREAARGHAREPGSVQRLELRCRLRDGSYRWLEASSVNRLEDPIVAAVVATFRDISERRRNEEERRRDQERHAELEDQLRQSQKMEAVGRLAGGIAHDFNNLLTAILGYGEILLDQLAPDDPSRVSVQQIHKAGERAAALTRQLLAFSRRQNLTPEVLDLAEVIRGLAGLIERLIGEDVTLRVAAAPEAGRVEADRSQLEQVILNLAVNARDAMPDGGDLTFTLGNVGLDEAAVGVQAGLRPGPHVVLTVSDTGTGMDAATLERIFEPFFTTKGPGKGTGLGLSTVHGIVHQSRGSISVSSQPGRGTTFEIHLPRAAAAAEVHGAAHAPSAAGPEPAPGTETILLVEDERSVHELVREFLEASGYTVLAAENPAAAERTAESYGGRIDLLLTDIVMPGKSGRALADQLRGRRPGMRVLYMSGYSDQILAPADVDKNRHAFLAKPFVPRQLAQKIREVLAAPVQEEQ